MTATGLERATINLRGAGCVPLVAWRWRDPTQPRKATAVLVHGHAELDVHLGVAAAFPRRDGTQVRQAGEYGAALRVGSTFFPLNGAPFTVSGHI